MQQIHKHEVGDTGLTARQVHGFASVLGTNGLALSGT